MVWKQLRRVEASLLAGSVRHDGFLTGCTFRELIRLTRVAEASNTRVAA